MKGTAISGLPTLDPCALQERGWRGVPEEWRLAVHARQPCAGLHITCVSGRPGVQWAFRSAGAAALNISILLAGHMRTAFDNAPALDADSGSLILMASGEHA
ncbi:MAG: hypothetical protein LBO00_02370, partial [Zoogloeaceae bacterium]|nr:hypothetical protein [Zoogloeaceae bacterium]